MLTHECKVSVFTQNQALCALLFPYRELLVCNLPWLNGLNRSVQTQRIPSVLTREKNHSGPSR
jgi:hypothetical protein